MVSFSPHGEACAPSAVCGIQKANITDQLEENLVSSSEFPWVVSIQDKRYTHLAFGCILSKFWILSTASALRHRPVLPACEGWEWDCPVGLETNGTCRLDPGCVRLRQGPEITSGSWDFALRTEGGASEKQDAICCV